MTVEQDVTTKSPWTFGVDANVVAEDFQRMARQDNAAAGGGCSDDVASFVTGLAGWGSSGNEPETHSQRFPATGAVQRYRMRRWLDDDAQALTVLTACDMPTGNAGSVRVVVGTASAVVHAHGAGVTELATSVPVATAGSGWIDTEVHLERTGGSDVDAQLVRIALRHEHVDAASMLPAGDA